MELSVFHRKSLKLRESEGEPLLLIIRMLYVAYALIAGYMLHIVS